MEKLKQTTNVKQAWVTLAIVLGVSFLFGWLVLPKLGRQESMAGSAAPDFALEVIHGGDAGNRMRLADLRGKVVVLDFWASWCKPCREQGPILDAFVKSQQGERVLVLGVDTGDARKDAVAYLAEHAPAYPSVIDEDGRVAVSYGVRGLPTVMVLDPQGRISAVRQGVVQREELEELVRAALEGG